MNDPTPPPLPDRDSAYRTYLRAGAFLVPTLLAWSFSTWFVLPKVQQLWQDAGLTTSRAQWLMEGPYSLMYHSRFIFAGVVILLFILEFRWSAWPRYRGTVVAGVTLLFHMAVLVGITAIAIAATLAAPVLAKARSTKQDIHAPQ